MNYMASNQKREWMSYIWFCGRLGISFVKRIHDQTMFGGRLLMVAIKSPIERPLSARLILRLTLDEIYQIIKSSLPTLLFIGFIVGVLWGSIWFNTLSNIGGLARLLSLVISIQGVTVSPILIGIVMVVTYCSSMTVSLSVIKSSNQFQTIASMGMPPEHILAIPKILACTLIMPVLVFLFNFFTIIAIYIISWDIVAWNIIDYLYELTLYAKVGQAVILCIKSFFISLVIAFFPIYNAWKVEVGPAYEAPNLFKIALTEVFLYSILASVGISLVSSNV